MKTIKYLVLILVMVFLLVGCFENNFEEENKNDNNTLNNSTSFNMGAWNDNEYTNNFLNVKLSLPESWVHYSDEEIASIMDLDSNSSFNDAETLEKISDLLLVYYVSASEPGTANSISVFSEKPIVDTTFDNYFEKLERQLTDIGSVKYEIGEKSSVKLNGVEYKTMEVNAPDYELVQKYYVYKLDKYFVGIIISSSTQENVSEIETYFKG